MTQRYDVVVVGGGIIGAGIAWRLAGRGLSAAIVDPSAGAGATGTAAGMLAPVTELHYGEEPLLALNLASAARYPEFVAELRDEVGDDGGYRRTGTVVAAYDGADLVALRDLLALQRRLGLSAELLSAAELRALEPAAAPGLPGGVLAADDHSVDPRRLHRALLEGCRRRGVDLVVATATAVTAQRQVALGDDPPLSAGVVVLATGAWTAHLVTDPALRLPVRPVKGQTLRLHGSPDLLRHVLRGSVRGFPVYLVPRGDGELVVGATSEETGYDVSHRAGAVLDLLRHAQALLPDLAETAVLELSTSLRPATPDNAPVIGTTGVDGVVAAVGHYRNGVLLAPVTADIVAAMVVDGVTPAEALPFGADRFAVGAAT